MPTAERGQCSERFFPLDNANERPWTHLLKGFIRRRNWHRRMPQNALLSECFWRLDSFASHQLTVPRTTHHVLRRKLLFIYCQRQQLAKQGKEEASSKMLRQQLSWTGRGAGPFKI